MINKLTYIESERTNPYWNLALEEYLLLNVKEGECILYLWQNEKTVVIGRNQNAWKECKFNQLIEDGGHLVRRLSGGGAVFHDLGNLNFTFLVCQKDYHVDKQLQVILNAIRKLGLPAEKTGRNDITISGRKFSGNAFYSNNGHCYHHGTLMVQVKIQDLTKYINVSRDKLKSKGVNSVKSRVANLADFDSNITVGQIKSSLVEAFGNVYGLTPQPYTLSMIDENKISQAEKKFDSWDWVFGKKIKFNYEKYNRFSWGDLSVQLTVNGGYIRDAVIYSDAIDEDLIIRFSEVLKDIVFDRKTVCSAISELRAQVELQEQKDMLFEICGFMESEDF